MVPGSSSSLPRTHAVAPAVQDMARIQHREDDMAERTNDEADLPQRDAGGRRHGSGPLITGRSFAGTSRASDQREQTADHRGENQHYRLDDGGSRVNENEERPADES